MKNIFTKFIFMIVFCIFILLSILNGTACNKKYIIKKMDRSHYVTKLTVDIREEVQNYTIQSGFSKNLFDDVFTEEDVRRDLLYVINNYYDKKRIDIDYTNLKEKINNKIDNYLRDNKSKANAKDINKFVDMISNVYKTKLTIGGNLKYLGKLNTISKISDILIPILFISMIICILIKALKDDLEFFISPIIAASLIYIFITIYIKNKIDIKNILVFGSNFSIVLRSIIFSILKYFKVIGFLGLLISILSIIILSIKRDKID